jgi:hypothetical protein
VHPKCIYPFIIFYHLLKVNPCPICCRFALSETSDVITCLLLPAYRNPSISIFRISQVLSHLITNNYPQRQTGHSDSLCGHKMDPFLTITAVSVLLGALIAVAFFGSYLSKRRLEVQSIAKAEPQSDPKKHPRPPQPKKSHSKAHSHSAADKVSSILNSLFRSREIYLLNTCEKIKAELAKWLR